MNQPVAPALAALTLSLTAIPAFAGTIDPALQVQLEARPYDLHNVLVLSLIHISEPTRPY